MSKRIAREEVLDYIRRSKARWKQDYGVLQVALFGSVARDEMTEDSDIDVLVDMPEPTYRNYLKLKHELENEFGTKIDLATFGAIKERAWPYINRDAIYA